MCQSVFRCVMVYKWCCQFIMKLILFFYARTRKKINSAIAIRVIPWKINMQNGHPSQILPKLDKHVRFAK